MIDPLEELRRMQSLNNTETFDRSTDSLEAIANALGIGPSVGLWMFGIVDATQVASTITIITNNLQNVPNDLLEGQFYMQVLYNTSAPATAPEGEYRQITNFVQGGALQTFTVDAFTANIEAGDMVAIFHQSILPSEILARGTLDTSSATVPEDSTRTEALNYFRGCILMTTEGAVRFQPRRIVTSSAAGVFTLDPNNPFTAVPGLVDYIIINSQTEFIPGVDGTNNRTPADVVGGKADTADFTPGATTSSIIRLVKGILASRVIAEGTLDASSATVPADSTRGEADNYFNGCVLVPLTGAVAFQPRRIVDYTGGTGVFTIDAQQPFTAATGLVDYIVIGNVGGLIPAVDAVTNTAVEHVVGGKADTAIVVPDNVSSAIRYLKGILNAVGATFVASGTFDTSSATVPADSTRGEANDYFNGCLLIPVAGAVILQPRVIVDYTGAGGIFTVDPGNPFTAATGNVDYVVIAFQWPFIPAADATLNRTTPDVVGGKADTIPAMNLAPAATWSIIRHLKAILERVGATPADPDDSLLTTIGQQDDTQTAGPLSNSASIAAMIKQAITQTGLVYFGDITTAADTVTFASTNLIGYEDDYFVGWWIFLVRDDGGASAAPQGGYRQVTDYVSATGTFTFAAFSAAHVVGDQVQIIAPSQYEAIAMRGGAETLESLDDELDAMLDMAEDPTTSILMDGTEQTVYEMTGSDFPFFFAGGFIDWTGANAGGGEDTIVRVKVKVDGTNYRVIYEETFLAAAVPVPVATAFPRPNASHNVPLSFYSKQDVIVTTEQAAAGGGFNTLDIRTIDAARGT